MISRTTFRKHTHMQQGPLSSHAPGEKLRWAPSACVQETRARCLWHQCREPRASPIGCSLTHCIATSPKLAPFSRDSRDLQACRLAAVAKPLEQPVMSPNWVPSMKWREAVDVAAWLRAVSTTEALRCRTTWELSLRLMTDVE